MPVADEKMLREVTSFLERQKLDYSVTEEQYCTKLTVKSSGQLVDVIAELAEVLGNQEAK